MSPAERGPVFDSDQHCYEPLDAFTRHLPAGWSERTVRQAEIVDELDDLEATRKIMWYRLAFLTGL